MNDKDRSCIISTDRYIREYSRASRKPLATYRLAVAKSTSEVPWSQSTSAARNAKDDLATISVSAVARGQRRRSWKPKAADLGVPFPGHPMKYRNSTNGSSDARLVVVSSAAAPPPSQSTPASDDA